MSVPPSRSSRLSPLVVLVSGALGLGWYLVAGGWRTLRPTNLDWLGDGDLSVHVLGWLMFRNEPWALPLGALSGYVHPLGSTVGYTDSNPWVSLLLKPFSGWLPEDFQFIGLWLAACFVLQGVFAAKVLEQLTPHPWQRVLGAALFVMAPPLIFRTGHDTLCAHWLLVGMLWLHLRPCPDRATRRRLLAWATGFTVLAAGIHPYLTAMVLALTVALLVRLRWWDRQLSWPGAAGVLALLGATVGGLFLALGYFGGSAELGATGFGHYSSDVLSLINPMGFSRWLPGLPAGPGQYEGFGYLGTGVLGLALVGALSLWRAPRSEPRAPLPWRSLLPLVGVTVLMALFSFSSKVTVAGKVVVSMRSVYEPLGPLVDPLRSSGRFIWPLHYLVLAGALALTFRAWRSRPAVATALVLAAAGLQAADSPSVWRGAHVPDAPWPRLRAPEWALLDGQIRHLALYPPYLSGLHIRECNAVDYPYQDTIRFADLAYRKRLTINSGVLARLELRSATAACEALKADVEAGRLAPDTVYVVHPSAVPTFTRPGSGAVCGTIEGHVVCTAADQPGRLREHLARMPPLLAAPGD